MTTDIKTFIGSILGPTSVESFFSEAAPAGTITVKVYDTPGSEPKQVVLDNIFPFSTLLDVKIALYNKFRRSDGAHPDFVFIGRPVFGTKMETVDYNWSVSMDPSKSVILYNPIAIASGKISADTKFVDANGDRRDVRRTSMERTTIEDKFGTAIPVLQAYFYSFLEGLIPGSRPISELDWNGRLYPYFPNLSAGTSKTVTPQQKTQAKKLADYFLVRAAFFRRLEQILNSGQPMYSLSLSGIQYLLLSFTKPVTIQGVEVLFYEVPVNGRRPYMRLMPVENTPISKVHMLPSNEPNLDNPRLLSTWSQEKNPTPERDYLMTKIFLKKLGGNTIPLYMTLRTLDDGTADITIEPPKPLKKLDPFADLSTLGDVLQSALEPFTHLKYAPKLRKGFFTFGVNLKDIIEEPYTGAIIRKKLPLFAAVFQEILPMEGVQPMIMLRYKLVSNFNREDRIQVFITQLLTLHPIHTESDLNARVNTVADEFQISMKEATEQVAKKLEKSAEIVAVNPDTKDYTLYNNPGVDIAIFAKHPTYYFHIYRADSMETVQRIITFLSIMFSLPVSEFTVREEDMVHFTAGEEESESRSGATDDAENNFRNVPDADAAEANNNFKSVPEEANNNFKSVPGNAAAEEEYPEYLTELMMEGEEAEAKEETLEAPEEEDAAIAPAAAAAAPAVPKPLAPAPIKPRQDVQLKSVAEYFSARLKDVDRKLFEYTPEAGTRKYVSQCNSNLVRQPASFTPEQFQRMKEEYKDELDNGTIRFYIFPLAKDAKKDAYDADPTKMEYYTIMKYGTSPSEQNYYMCCKYYCVRDEMMVREVEVRGPALRKNYYVKNPDGSVRKTKLDPSVPSCPMCEGKVIQNRKYPGVNETILERIIKSGTTDARHLYVRFLKKTNHPDGFYLPCCFLEDQPLRMGDPQFPEPSKEQFVARAKADAPTDPDAPPPAEFQSDQPSEEMVQKITVSYEETILQARTAYISGMEKAPLDPALRKFKKIRRDKTGAFVEEGDAGKSMEISAPQIGLLPPLLNEYFSQNTIDLVSRSGNQKLIPNSKGFLRVGVDNRQRPDSFLAAVAPVFRFNSVEDFKDFLSDLIQPRLFLGLNFGNLMLEMYDPMWVPRILSKGKPTDQEMKLWAFTELKIAPYSFTKNRDLVRRAFLSYDRFIWWLQSNTTVKHYRHFAHLFSLPGIMNVGTRKYTLEKGAYREFRRPGVLFIVLEITASGELKMRCPPYPLNSENYLRMDIAFLLHDQFGNWEPIFYYTNNILSEDDTNQAKFSFSVGRLRGKEEWPPVLEERLKEFKSQCSLNSGGLGIYASSLGLNSRKVVPLLRVKNILEKYEEISLYGLLRDSYNHVAALVYRTDKNKNVAVPVIEDGVSYSYHQDTPDRLGGEERPQFTLVLDTKIIFDWDDFEPAPMNQVIEFYKKYIDPHFSELYEIQRSIKSAGTEKIEAVQLKNGLYIPVSAPEEGAAAYNFPDKKSPRVIQEMEWSINKRIVVESTSSLEEIYGISEINKKEMTESFEHLRITFSNWLSSAEGGAKLRSDLQGIIVNRDLPLFEKRKRIEIHIGSTVEKWIAETADEEPRQISLLRVDCLTRKKDECSNMCEWKEDAGKCLIHARKEKDNGQGHASTAQVLLRRLIEELIRFGNRRREIFEQRVSQLAAIDNPIRMDDQYILPEKSVAWTDMLRKEWSSTAEEKPLYLEEMRREQTEADKKPLGPVNEMTALPKIVEGMLGEGDPLTARLRMYPSPNFEPFVGLFGTTLEAIGLASNATVLTSEALGKLARKARLPIVQYDIREDPPKILGKRMARDQEIGYAIFVVGAKGPSLLVTDVEAPEILKKEELPKAFVELLNSKTVERIFAFGVGL